MGAFTGPVFRPGDDGYDAERSGFNLTVDHHPELIVGATGPDDVIAAVEYAAARGLAVAVLTTGHGPAVPADGQVLVTTRRMSDVRVDPAARTARVGGGVRWRQVLPETVPHGLAPLNGSSPNVGVVGYTLGGGVGPLGRSYGFAADRVRRVDLVTADGRLRQVTADGDPELFWAVRGGKGNFGVVVGLEFDLVPVSRLYGGGLFFPAEATADVLHAYSRWLPAAPEEMSSSVLLVTFPPIPEVPEIFRGRYIAHLRLAFTGIAEEGERLVRPLREIGSQILDTLGEMPYTEVGTIFNDPTEPARVYDSNISLHTLDEGAVDTLLSLAGPDTGSPLLIEMRQLGGAYARPPAIPSAVGGRDAAYTLFAASILEPGQEDAIRRAHEQLAEKMRPWATGGTVFNFSGVADATPERVKLAFTPADYARLAKAKATYDPDNMFRVNFNIPPAL
ncbi:oxidoreductase [Sphaerisporangium siamense]|uniref:FAD/FMN-containing dehydrogenase n=1 Tax=Sphaerisporangium siamense TaxID=795645 RepID=A0A7W7GCB7_9ACTN|nr:FAD-binding oxidoreductase [Sphaerisporangium siamense]MBB4701861.1 FAD/FMN-containing dehydrogenase [Sphaerisporangium siamense]GII84231.1 oxidoreductase [Sphaerisporangium siamense]